MNDTAVVRPRRTLRTRPPLALLVRPRVTARAIAQRAGVSDSLISLILAGYRPANRAVRDAAVELTGLPEEALFGDRLADGDDAA